MLSDPLIIRILRVVTLRNLIAGLFVTTALCGCSDLVTRAAPRMTRLQLLLPAELRSDTRDIIVRVSYKSDSVVHSLVVDTLLIDVSATQAPVQFDITPCFNDERREATSPAGACRIYVELTLRNAAGTALDTKSAQPLDVRADATTVTVPPIALTDINTIRITPVPYALGVGDTLTLSTTLLDNTGATLPNRSVTWSSASPSVASVNANGVLQLLDTGVATIRATRDGRADSLRVQSYSAVRNPRCAGHLTLLTVNKTVSDSVIKASQSPYRLVTPFSAFQNRRTRVEPGVTVCAEAGVSIAQSTATLLAQGTASARIAFTASDTTRGWSGIALGGPIVDSSRFENVDIEYVGTNNGEQALLTLGQHPVVLQDVHIRRGKPTTAIFLSDTRAGGRLTRVTIDSTGPNPVGVQSALYLGGRFVTIDSLIIRSTPGYGIIVGSAGDTATAIGGLRMRGVYVRGAGLAGMLVQSVIPPLSVTDFTVSGSQWPLTTSPQFQTGWPAFDGTRLTGNQQDSVFLNGGAFTGTFTMSAGVPWRANFALTLGANSRLVIEAGARVAFAATNNGPGIVSNNANSSIIVSGTAANPAILTTPSPAFRWGGILWMNVTGNNSWRGLTVRRVTGSNAAAYVVGTGALSIDESVFDDVVTQETAVHTDLSAGQFVTNSTFTNIQVPVCGLEHAGIGPAITRSVTFDNITSYAYCSVGQLIPSAVTIDSVQISNSLHGIYLLGNAQISLRAININTLTSASSVALMWESRNGAQLDARNLWWGVNRAPPTTGKGAVIGNVLTTPFATQPHGVVRRP